MAGEPSDDAGSDTIGPLGGDDDGRVWVVWKCALWTLLQEPWQGQDLRPPNPCLGLTLSGALRVGINLSKS